MRTLEHPSRQEEEEADGDRSVHSDSRSDADDVSHLRRPHRDDESSSRAAAGDRDTQSVSSVADKGKAARAPFYDLSHNEQSSTGSARALVATSGLASNVNT